MSIFSLELFYAIAGLILLGVAVQSVRRGAGFRRWGAAGFWGLFGLIFLLGKRLPYTWVGWMLLAMVVLAALRQVGRPVDAVISTEQRLLMANRLGNWLFLPALLIPATTALGTLCLAKLRWHNLSLLDPGQPTLSALGLGGLIAAGVGLRLTRSRLSLPLAEGARLLHSIGWALILPQLLAALGGIFSQAGVGQILASIVANLFPTEIPIVAVAVYCLGMALFTICLGNAFAAFPVITLGIGLPLIVQKHGGNPAIMAAFGMLSGYCGTLVTPMAANFNIVPVMLLEIEHPHAVIRAQAPMALVILLANIVLMSYCVFRF